MSFRVLTEPLVSNGFTLSQESHRLGWLQPPESNTPMAQLRTLYREQGYLWLKGILEREAVLTFRARYFEALQETGLLAPNSQPVDGIYNGQWAHVNVARPQQVYMDSVRWSSFEAFCTSPRLWNFYTSFFEDEPYLHNRKLIRYGIPGQGQCTGGHYDLIYLRAGTDRICTSWIPLGDTTVEMGGSIYLEASDAFGRQIEAEFTRKNAELSPEERISAYNQNMKDGGWISTNLPEMAEKFDTRWLIADYEAGDMVIHSHYMIHASTNNSDALNRIRLSTDIRYQRKADKIDTRWNRHWELGDGL